MPLEAVDAVCYEPLYVICCGILIQLLNDSIMNIELLNDSIMNIEVNPILPPIIG